MVFDTVIRNGSGRNAPRYLPRRRGITAQSQPPSLPSLPTEMPGRVIRGDASL